MDHVPASQKTVANEVDIHLIFPVRLFEELCKDCGINNKDEVDEKSVLRLFVIALGQWITGSISTEDLSAIASFLSTKCIQKGEIIECLMDASELSYYIRYTTDVSLATTLSQFIKHLHTFYEANKTLVQSAG